MTMLRTGARTGALIECLLQPTQARIEHDGLVPSALKRLAPHVRPQHEHQAVHRVAERVRLDRGREHVRHNRGLTLAKLPVNQELVHDANDTLNALISCKAKEARALPDDNALGAL